MLQAILVPFAVSVGRTNFCTDVGGEGQRDGAIRCSELDAQGTREFAVNLYKFNRPFVIIVLLGSNLVHGFPDKPNHFASTSDFHFVRVLSRV